MMRVLVVCNLLSGTGDTGVYDLVHALGAEDCEVTIRYFAGTGTLESLVRDAIEFDRVVVAGGDGTISTIGYALAYSGIPMLAYPSGTANLISSNLGLPFDARNLAKLTVSDNYENFDVGELTHLGSHAELPKDRRLGFMMIAGAGFDAAIMDAAQPLKTSMGVLAYFAGVMANLAPTRATFHLTLDGHKIVSDGIAVLIVNFSRLQFDLPLTHGSSPRDGLFEVAVVKSRTAVGLIPAVWDAWLDRVVTRPERGALDVHTAREIFVEADPPLRLQYDGDVIDTTTPFGAHVLPGAATLLVPPASRHAGVSRHASAPRRSDARPNH